METSEVRQRVTLVIDRAKRDAVRRRMLSDAASRRMASDDANREWWVFLDSVAVPLFHQVANVLKVENYAFTVFMPESSVRLMSDRRQEDFIELTLDTTGVEPMVLGRASHARGGDVVVRETPIAAPHVRDITEDQVLTFVVDALEAFVER